MRALNNKDIKKYSSARDACFTLMSQLQKHGRIDIFGQAPGVPGESKDTDIRDTAISDNSCSTSPLFGEARGHMFGILVCCNDHGEEVIFRAFSGQYNGLWDVFGWVPPLIDPGVFAAVMEKGEAEIKALTREIDALKSGSVKGGALSREEDRRRVKGLSDQRKRISQELMVKIHDLYILANFEGETQPMAEVFGNYSRQENIPSGTGDCCLPKLLHAAALAGVKPIEAAEFYWGQANRSGTRFHGRFYPPCREKCHPILGFILKGLEEETASGLLKGAGGIPLRSEEPLFFGLDIIYTDSHIVVINKPSGLLSVPGRGPGGLDSVTARVKKAFPGCPDQPSVHRLDMDTSGLLVFALTPRAQRNLSIQFQKRRVQKEYLALMDGTVEGRGGKIKLSFRLEPSNRPYQVWDPEKGKVGETLWTNLGRNSEGRTLIHFSPLTGRTHQLRLHSAHPFGLGVPIRGDRLYGRGLPCEFLRLHAGALSFYHPETGRWMDFHSFPPFKAELPEKIGDIRNKSLRFLRFLP
ncbi:MAG: RluA family pseudouridine synthase [Spirochaetales bacterium]|nr:RluA family pseudouridine synthase [Spirochaetales bacterium]